MRTYLTILFSLLISSVRAELLPAIPTHSGWVTVKNHDLTSDGFKVFRRYSFIEQTGKDFPNLINFMCSKNPNKVASHLDILLPKIFQLDSFPRDRWLPQTVVRFLIDDDVSVSVPGEYKNEEFFIDWTPDTDEALTKIMLSNKLAIGFGDKNDVVQFQFTDVIDKVFSEEKLTPPIQFTHYARAGAGGILDACQAHQKGVVPRTNPESVSAAPASAPNSANTKKQNPATPSKDSKVASPTNSAATAHAADPRCNAPPYGSTEIEYKAFVKNFGRLLEPDRLLKSICDVKYNGASRTGLYNLGLTDDDIDGK